MSPSNSSRKMEENSKKLSLSPSGEKFTLPQTEDFKTEFDRLQSLVDDARKDGKEIVVVMGVGFVGAVMAAIVADTTDRLSKTQCSELLEDSTAKQRRISG